MKIKYYFTLVAIILVSTAASLILNRLGVNKENILMILIVGVLLITSLTRGYHYGIIASFISALVFNYFFTDPLHTFNINDTNDVTLMLFFLIAALISSSLTARFQHQLLISQKNELIAKQLYEVTLRLFKVTGEENIIHNGVQFIEEHTGLNSEIILSAANNNITNVSSDPSTDYDIIGLSKKLGILRVYSEKGNIELENQWLINAVAAQMGLALDREYIYNERENIRIAMEKEKLKANLLRSVSHDLRTPLTGIVGASSLILNSEDRSDIIEAKKLAKDIHEQAIWLATLVENILNMTRIENSRLAIKKQLEVVDDVINEALTHVSGLQEREFIMNMPNDVIALKMDGKMIMQVLINLLNNAVTHTMKDGVIKLSVEKSEPNVRFIVEDGGSGIDEKIRDDIFGAFVTSGKIGPDGRKGIGLGLAICKAVVEAHGGNIVSDKSQMGGAVFTFTLPLEE